MAEGTITDTIRKIVAKAEPYIPQVPKPKKKIPLPPIKGDVKYENVSFSFESSTKKTLSNIDLHIKPGTFVGVAGQSGSGKSTLINETLY